MSTTLRTASTRPDVGRVRRLPLPGRRGPGRAWQNWSNLLFVLPAVAFYGFFVLRPLATSLQYSFYEWNGIGPSSWVGFANYREALTDSDQLITVLHAFELMLFFTVLPVGFGLLAAALMHGLPQGGFTTLSRTILFIPQVIPLVAAGIVWDWVYATDGIVNQLLAAVGLESVTRPWLGDFSTALLAVGSIGAWVLLGLCTLLLLTGMSKIDASLYEAARLDGANRFREFLHVTLPGLRREIGVCVTITMIAALASFDIIYITTGGGPGRSTMVPGVEIYRLAFTEREVGLASAMAVILMVLVLMVVLPIQRITQKEA